MKVLKKNQLLKNTIINIFSAGILTGITQLLIFPFISRQYDVETFGIIVSLHGFKTLIMNFIGNSMNNIRLIYNDKVTIKGNFKIILYICLFLAVIFSALLFNLYGVNIRPFEIVILTFITVLATFRIYLVVYFRIEFDYNKIFITNILIISGYLIGLLLFNVLSYWWLVFLVGELFGVIYSLRNSNFLYEKVKPSRELFPLLKETMNLIFSNSISNGLGYLDRFLITPIINATAMSTYYSVSIFSKIINMLVVPFNNVLLSYITKNSNKKNKNLLVKLNILLVVSLIPIYFILNFLTPYLLKIFYPHFLKNGIKYIAIINLGTILKLLGSLTNTFILKLHKMNYQVSIQLIYAIIYLISALYLTINKGLMGFAIATAGSNFIKWFLLLCLGILIPSSIHDE